VRDASLLASPGDNGANATDGTRDATTFWSRSPGGCCSKPGESLDGARRAVAPSCPGSCYLETRSQPIADGERGCRYPALAPPHDAGTDARRTADGSVLADRTPPPPQGASNLPDPAAAATPMGDSGASPSNAGRHAEQSAVAELTTLVRTLAASVRELRVDVTTLRDPTGTLAMSTASGPRPTDPTPANTLSSPRKTGRHAFALTTSA